MMKYALPIVGVALALSLGGTAIAAEHDRGPRGAREQATQQNHENQRFDRRGDRPRAAQHQQRQRQGGWRNNNGPRSPFADNQQQRQRFDQHRPQQQRVDRQRPQRPRFDQQRPQQPRVDRQRPQQRYDNNYRQPRPTADHWRKQNVRTNWQQYRRNFHSPKRYRIGAYHGPRGYQYRRWFYGERLPSIYYARPFWLFNVIAYGLFTPPPGLIWVRYGDDALLIDRYTGEIVQVRYNVFY